MRFYFKALIILITVVACFIILNTVRTEYLNVNISNSGKVQEFHNEEYNVWCIFTKVRAHKTIKDKLQTMLISLLNNTSTVITLNLITDSLSRFVAKDVLSNVRNSTGKDLKV